MTRPMEKWTAGLLLPWLLSACHEPGGVSDWWLTADQQGQRLYRQGEYRAAAEKFTDADRMGMALYKAGDYADAASVYGQLSSPQAAFNRGNALIMQGQYEQAIESYQRALTMKPGWREASENQQIAQARLQALAPPDDDAGGTGSQLAADDYVVDQGAEPSGSNENEMMEAADSAASDQAMRALWLRRVETTPAQFLSAKFSYQRAMELEPGDSGAESDAK